MLPLIIIGAGGHGRSIAEAVQAQARYAILGFLDDGLPPDSMPMGYRVLGKASELESLAVTSAQVVVGLGANAARESATHLIRAAGFALATVIHPWSNVSPTAMIGEGSVLMAGAIIGNGAQLGQSVIINAGTVVDHDVVIEDFAHLGVGVRMAGASRVGRSGWLQAGVSIGVGVSVPAGAVVPCGQGLSHWTSDI